MTLGAHVLKNIKQPRALLQIVADDEPAAATAAGGGAASGDGAEPTAEESAAAIDAERRQVRAQMLAIEDALDGVLAVEGIDDGSALDESEETRNAECDRIMQRLDVFVLPYGSNKKLTRGEVARADNFFLSVVRSRKGAKLLARALDVLPLEHAVRVLLFYVRNLLTLARDADEAADDPSVGAIFGHLVGIVGASERQQVVVALQTLISFHSAEQALRSLLATEGGAAVITALLQRAHSLGLHGGVAGGGDDDSLVKHWREIFSYLVTRTVDVLGEMAESVVTRGRSQTSAQKGDDDDDDDDDEYANLSPERVWSLCIALALHADGSHLQTMREQLTGSLQGAPVTQSQLPLMQTLATLLQAQK